MKTLALAVVAAIGLGAATSAQAGVWFDAPSGFDAPSYGGPMVAGHTLSLVSVTTTLSGNPVIGVGRIGRCAAGPIRRFRPTASRRPVAAHGGSKWPHANTRASSGRG
jgi:hypothetical protein